MGITKKLSEFITHTKYEDLVPEVLNAAKVMFMDTLGCGIAGFVCSQKEVAPVVKVAQDMGGKAECTLLVSGEKSSWFNAILVNGTFMHAIDYDDTRTGLATHVGAVLVPSILAMSEKLNASGKAALLAAVVGYDAVSRVALATMPTHYHYWHSTGTNGTFGGAAAAGKLFGFNAHEMEAALGIAADQASGMISCLKYGDLTKSLHAGLTSAKGVLSAMLVKHGATGPMGILEYSKGYCNAYSKAPKLQKIVEGLGDPFEIINNAPKFYPTIVGSHCAIAAALKLVRENDIKADDVVRIDNHTFQIRSVNPNPATPLAARLSTPYCIAVAILDREVGMKQFEHQRLLDPRIKALIGKIHIETDPELERLKTTETGMYPARISLTTKNGDVFSASEYYPKGAPMNPISIKELEEKFETLCAGTFSKGRIQKIISAIQHMETLDHMSQLTKLLAKGQ